jgi:serine/threonine protein kinase
VDDLSEPPFDATRTGFGLNGAADAAGAAPATIGGYVIVGTLGEGGMGVVYEAEQRNPRRRVALKVVRGGQFVDELHVRMFQREVETLARLKHPDIGAILEAGRTDDGRHHPDDVDQAGRVARHQRLPERAIAGDDGDAIHLRRLFYAFNAYFTLDFA